VNCFPEVLEVAVPRIAAVVALLLVPSLAAAQSGAPAAKAQQELVQSSATGARRS
jgi:hypothetical protein